MRPAGRGWPTSGHEQRLASRPEPRPTDRALPRCTPARAALSVRLPVVPAITADDAAESAAGVSAGLPPGQSAGLCPGTDSVRRPRGSSLGEASEVVTGSLLCEITFISAVAVSS